MARERVFALQVQGKDDMTRIEKVVGGLLGSKGSRCALVRSQDFINLRLCALYNRGQPPMTVYGEGVQVCLDREKNVTVYLFPNTAVVPDARVLLGKRSEPESLDDRDP
jgi:hypothetical protein